LNEELSEILIVLLVSFLTDDGLFMLFIL